MKTLLTVILWAFLEIIAPVQLTPVNVVTATPDNIKEDEDDVFREVMTDGFIVDDTFTPSLKQQSSKSNTSVQLSDTQHPTSGSGEGSAHEIDIMEGSGLMEGSSGDTTFFLSSSPSVVLHQNSTPEDWNSNSFATKRAISLPSSTPSVEVTYFYIAETTTGFNPDSRFSSTSSPSTSISSTPVFSINHHSDTKHEAPAVSSTEPSISRAGFGVNHIPRLVMVMERSTSASALLPAASSDMIMEEIITQESTKELLHGPVDQMPDSKADMQSEQKDHGGPGWVIILAFVVGVTAMVLLAVAIATRDRWYRSTQALKEVSKDISSNQQRELEMETFLQKAAPGENGHAGEYTIIPLSESLEKEQLS